MLVSSPNGAYFIPAQGYIRPANVPTNVMGLVLVNFYDSEGRETRTRVPITLLGNGTSNGQQPVPQSVLPQTQASQPVTQTPLFPLPGAAGTVRTAGPQTAALPPPPSPRTAGLPPPPPLPPEAVALPSVADPDLSRELMMAQTTQLRSLTLQAEEAAGSAIDLEKMSGVACVAKREPLAELKCRKQRSRGRSLSLKRAITDEGGSRQRDEHRSSFLARTDRTQGPTASSYCCPTIE